MPTKITESAVCRQIIDQREEALRRVMERGATNVGYTRSNFIEDMRAGDFIASQATILAKWDTLKADGVVEVNRGRAELIIPTLYLRAGKVRPIQGVATHTNTYTQTEGASE